ncbi:MAG: polysaccharide pyruvyl transferase family protein [Pseudomonadota bacterium]
MSALALMARVRREDAVPLAWAGGAKDDRAVPFGSALAPVIVSWLTGRPVRRVPFISPLPRLVAGGTIGQNITGGDPVFWGTGCARTCTPPDGKRRRFSADAETRRHLAACRGPFSAALLSGGAMLDARLPALGDPLTLLPEFYHPRRAPRHELGVVLSVEETDATPINAPNGFVPGPVSGLTRYALEPTGGEGVRIIPSTVAPTLADLRGHLDAILACKRIVSTCSDALAIAESYGIPCLAIAEGGPPGLTTLEPAMDGPLDLRVADLYAGLGRSATQVWRQPRTHRMPWPALIAAIDHAWQPAEIDTKALADALPIDLRVATPGLGASIWDHPVLADLCLAEDLTAMRQRERQSAEAVAAAAKSMDALRLPIACDPGQAAAAPSLRLIKCEGDAIRRRSKASISKSALEAATSSVTKARSSTKARGKEARRSGTRIAQSAGSGAAVVEAGASAKIAQPLAIPLCWAAGSRTDGFANLGDALSAVVVAGISGLPVRHLAAQGRRERLAAVGTIGHSLAGGHVHLWGTGLDQSLSPTGKEGGWSAPPDTRFSVHATRGPETAEALRREGIAAPEIFGDPVYLLPKLFPMDPADRQFDLGIVLHLSELDERTPAGGPEPAFRRYSVPPSLAKSVRVINMYADASMPAFRSKIAEIASCRRILSTSLHGLVIADAYGIPSAWFSFFGRGLRRIDLLDGESKIDHRMRDLYGGLGFYEVPVYATPRHEPTDFDDAIRALDEEVRPSGFDAKPLLTAFPGPIAVDPDAKVWPLPTEELEGVIL